MKKRVIVACIGIPLLILALSFTPDWVTMLLVGALCAVGAHEMMHAVSGKNGKRLIPITMTVAALLCICIFLEKKQCSMGRMTDLPLIPWTALVAVIFVLLLFFSAIFHYDRETAIPFADLSGAMFAGLIFPLMLSCLLRLRMMENGQVMVWIPLAIAFGSDTCALFAGMAFGKHKMAPRVSPHKTIEGGIGGLAGGIAGLLVLKLVVTLFGGTIKMGILPLVLLGTLGGAIGEIGDLSFSVIKREFGVKDYGKLLPGHGGVLDRFDSVTFITPFVCILCGLM
jgi:phosphatidate cytidylyltransferase